jgi:uncharacterized protein (DUF1330 family)
MAAYIIAEVDVTDPDTYAGYRELVPPSLEKYGGRFLVRGGTAEALEGPQPKRVVILEFDDAAAARRWYNSPEYVKAKAIRQSASTGRLIMVEGVKPA